MYTSFLIELLFFMGFCTCKTSQHTKWIFIITYIENCTKLNYRLSYLLRNISQEALVTNVFMAAICKQNLDESSLTTVRL